mgnify:CR=1 FL=1|tara:strand:- start:663 stop:860 length:198 start_codon:yes stop_codon:yes gene_type:complete
MTYNEKKSLRAVALCVALAVVVVAVPTAILGVVWIALLFGVATLGALLHTVWEFFVLYFDSKEGE